MKSRSYILGTGRSVPMKIAAVLAILVGSYLIFEFGRIQADYNIADSILEQRAFENEIDGLHVQIAELKQEIALLETHKDIDVEAYQVIEANLSKLQRKIEVQENAIAFYRGILSPKDGGRGLKVQDLKLTKGKDEGSYRVRLVLVQVMQHDRSVKGEVDFSLEGAQDGVAMTYKLEQLLPEDVDDKWAFSFRYFQDFERELIIPNGFVPEKVNIEVISRTKSIASVKQSFTWLSAQS